MSLSSKSNLASIDLDVDDGIDSALTIWVHGALFGFGESILVLCHGLLGLAASFIQVHELEATVGEKWCRW